MVRSVPQGSVLRPLEFIAYPEDSTDVGRFKPNFCLSTPCADAVIHFKRHPNCFRSSGGGVRILAYPSDYHLHNPIIIYR